MKCGGSGFVRTRRTGGSSRCREGSPGGNFEDWRRNRAGSRRSRRRGVRRGWAEGGGCGARGSDEGRGRRRLFRRRRGAIGGRRGALVFGWRRGVWGGGGG